MEIGITSRATLAAFFAFICLATIGCGTTAPAFNAGDQLAPNEGALALVSHSRRNNIVLLFRKQGSIGDLQESGPFHPGVAFRMVRLPAGEYSIDGLSANGDRYQFDGPQFTIKPGVINYIGDSFVTWAGPRYVNARFVDHQDRLDAYLTERFPEMVKRYPVQAAAKMESE